MTEADVYNALGEDGFQNLVAAFYRRVKTDSILAPLYPQDDFEGAEERLRLFLIQRFGGPQHYHQRRGHPRLRMRHAPFPVDLNARNRWMELMSAAMDELKIDAEIRVILHDYFHSTATHMMNT